MLPLKKEQKCFETVRFSDELQSYFAGLRPDHFPASAHWKLPSQSPDREIDSDVCSKRERFFTDNEHTASPNTDQILEKMQVAIASAHCDLQHLAKAAKPDVPWHPQASPDRRFDPPQGYLDLVR